MYKSLHHNSKQSKLLDFNDKLPFFTQVTISWATSRMYRSSIIRIVSKRRSLWLIIFTIPFSICLRICSAEIFIILVLLVLLIIRIIWIIIVVSLKSFKLLKQYNKIIKFWHYRHQTQCSNIKIELNMLIALYAIKTCLWLTNINKQRYKPF